MTPKEKDTYKTILKPGKETLFKDRGSKFFGYAFPVTSEDDVKECLETLKKQHHTARHFCYAWQLGKNYESYRANDDGEPSNSAGMPIYGQLQAFDVTNVLVVSVRYFGGTKLGVGGLIQAYKTSAQLALEASKIVLRTIDEKFVLKFDYPEMNTVMRIVKDENLKIVSQKLELDCEITLSVRKKDAARIFELFENTYKVTIKRAG
ncbi:IMPACT family protein [Marinirhabdus gelatinilytica]|uniref:Putative YigZ family protein n=1 Tax=Marinirhabdus gelatinilytica TaxID=1703343 RepID=A0A370QEQ6_9FLAO|nr:YigZ family protein [Marinirhabdus gelatinilytica]RDK86852.1 putative YigZ family protein [Marinirhabdus gelatinilytica]